MKIVLLLIGFILGFNVYGEEKSRTEFFIAYDLGEMAFNQFQNFAGEVGCSLPNKSLLRFVYMNVKLTEEHLSSEFAQAVEGADVEGLFLGYELFYSYPVYNNFYAGLSIGYYENSYQHMLVDEEVTHQSPSIGVEFSYRKRKLFGIKGLYYDFTIPIRYYLNPLEELTLGDTIIGDHIIENNIWFFIGYTF